MRLLLTGGAGFVGTALGRLFREAHPHADIVAFDNLKRRGSELSIRAFKDLGITFVYGDVRSAADLHDVPGNFDLLIEASAEPSVHAGTQGQGCRYLLDTNLGGTLNCLEFARQRAAGMIFLSTSRVYAIAALRALLLTPHDKRFELAAAQVYPGVSARGIAEDFPTVNHGFRSLYGTSKLASELLIEEYAANFAYPVVINRCGVIAGAGQFGKTDQGVFTLWVARHLYGGGTLQYTGFGGAGKQVRDLLHPSDLFALISRQMDQLELLRGQVFNVGGGLAGSVSLREYTELCAEATGARIAVGSLNTTADVDVPYYVTDTQRAHTCFDWQPRVTPRAIVDDICGWLRAHRTSLQPLFE